MKLKSLIVFSAALLLVFSNCKKKDIATSLILNDLSMDSANVVVNAGIQQLNANSVVDYGICWATTDNPLMDEYKFSLGSKAVKGDFSATIPYIVAGKYYFRLYLADGNSVFYSNSKQYNVASFIRLSTYNITVPALANSAVFQIYSNSTWASTYNAAWLIPVNTTGQYNAPFNFGFTDNYSSALRTATIDITCGTTKKTVIINQLGYGPYLLVHPSTQNVPSTAGTIAYNVISNTNWTVSCADSWVTLNNTSGANNGSINLNYADNITPTPRTATIIASNGGITYDVYVSLTQAAFTTTSTIPTVLTSPVSNITLNGANCGGNVTQNGGAAVTARGICWSTITAPSTADAHTTDGAGVGVFPSTMTSLTANTTYFVRAYATNINGTAYGNEFQFITNNTATLPTCNCGPGGQIFVHPTDNSASIVWSITQMNTGANSPTDGETNTNSIYAANGSLTMYAARVCYDLNAFGFTDWYLPSIQELNCMYQNKALIGGFTSGNYWSSSEVTMNAANSLNFGTGNPSQMNKGMVNAVRCIRK